MILALDNPISLAMNINSTLSQLTNTKSDDLLVVSFALSEYFLNTRLLASLQIRKSSDEKNVVNNMRELPWSFIKKM